MRQGFSAALNAIVDNLPAQRQTLLFSATQTKSVKDLARLSLRSPEYLAVHAEAEVPTPIKLQQAYIVCPLQDKTDILWSFIRSHLKVSAGQCSGWVGDSRTHHTTTALVEACGRRGNAPSRRVAAGTLLPAPAPCAASLPHSSLKPAFPDPPRQRSSSSCPPANKLGSTLRHSASSGQGSPSAPCTGV